MAARRCSTCAINYPPSLAYEKCGICGGRADFVSNLSEQDDWEERLEAGQKALTSMPEIETRADTNRLDRFRDAGLDLDRALQFAGKPSVDLHLFERLIFEGCAVDTAAAIVSPLDS